MAIDHVDFDRLAHIRTIDLTTYGRRSGLPRRVEIWWFRFEGRFIITGTPGRRDWLANVKANPEVVVHASGYDLVATATPVDDPAFRRRFFNRSETSWYSTQAGLEHLVATAPMIQIQLSEKADHL